MKKVYFIFLIVFVYGANLQSGWQVLNSGVTAGLNALYFTDLQTGYVCGTGGVILKTTTGGMIWVPLASSVAYELSDICFADNMTGFCAGFNGIIRTTNGGNNWVTVYNGQMNAVCYTQNVVYSGGQNGVYRSTDFGNNWTQLYSSSPYNVSGIYFNNTSTGQLMGNNGLMRKTTNGGLNWFFGGVWYPGDYRFSKCYFFNSGSGFVCYSWYSGPPNYQSTYGIYKCNQWTDTAGSWTSVWYNSVYSVCGIAITGADTGYAVGGTTGYQSLILKTINGGNIWTPSNYTANEILYDVFFLNSNSGYASGRNGIILKTTDGGITPVQNISIEIPKSFSLSQNYPNPFNPTTMIKFSIPPSNGARGMMNVRLIIYDILGREISTLVNERLSPGTYEVEWDGSKYHSGVYFYKLITEVFTQTRKMILIK